ncbi:MAG: hypothetical protein LC792_23475 [Actinobacteria bacterium]|nr:hypothetical protein [Actinomycetota bacterium]
MRRRLGALAGLVVLVVVTAPSAAYPEGDDSLAAPVTFAAEVFATPSYHLVEIPKVEEGGEGFTWAYLNQQPESWGRALLFWPGPTAEATFGTSVPQQGPLTGHRWKSPGAWSSYPTGGEARGMADYGQPVVPLGTTVDTPGGTMQLLSLSGRAAADGAMGETAFGSFSSSVAPVRMGFGRASSSAQREESAAVSSGWAVTRDVQIGDVSIAEIRSDASVRATPAGETGTWKLTIAGVTIAGQRLEWTNNGVSFAPGSDAPLKQLNTELAKGAESFRSDFQLVPGRVWRDDAGTHVQSGFLEMGHRPVILENNPGQKLEYALSVVSARALYRLGDPQGGLGEDLPAADPPVPAPTTAAPGPPAVEATPEAAEQPPAVLIPPSVAYRDAAGVAGPAYPSVAAVPAPPQPSTAAGGEVALAVPGASGLRARAAPAFSTLGEAPARDLRSGIGLLALAGMAAALAVLRAGRRQLEVMGASREGGSA